MLHTLGSSIRLPQAPEALFPFFSDPRNLERITPPELRFRIVDPRVEVIREGAHIHYRLRLWGLVFGWVTVIRYWEPPHRFVDEQYSGPYRLWRHHHELIREGSGTVMRDHVDYALPLGPLGELGHPLIRRQLVRIFEYRHRMMQEIFAPAQQEPPAVVIDGAAEGPGRPLRGGRKAPQSMEGDAWQ